MIAALEFLELDQVKTDLFRSFSDSLKLVFLFCFFFKFTLCVRLPLSTRPRGKVFHSEVNIRVANRPCSATDYKHSGDTDVCIV